MGLKLKGHELQTEIGRLKIIKKLGKGKSGVSFLCEGNNSQVVLKIMHDEPCPYYHFSDNKIKLEVEAFNKLKELGVTIPELLLYDAERMFLIKEYIDGPTGIEWLSGGGMDTSIIGQLFGISEKLRQSSINIDYFPANFVLSGRQLYYVDYEINNYDDKWSFEKWGIYYWANNEGISEYHRTGNWMAINAHADSGIPIKAPFEEKVKGWMERFGS